MQAVYIQIRGIVQGVGFRPFVYRLARALGLSGWVRNAEQGVEIHVEGAADPIAAFTARVRHEAPPAARIVALTATPVDVDGHTAFEIVLSQGTAQPTVRVSPDLPVCEDCLAELRDAADRRGGYPYINCTNCGPRYSIMRGLPYDRPLTTMRDWPLCDACRAEYTDPNDRRFHAQPVACAACGPGFELIAENTHLNDSAAAIADAARRLLVGEILAVKGIGGYHLACDARQPHAVRALRERKYRKEKPFALMVRDLATAEQLVELDASHVSLLRDVARPIVLAPARTALAGVAPGNHELGVMLPYAPMHHLLFDAGAPHVLVMTSANRSNEPLVYQDDAAQRDLAGIADAFLIGRREIARRVDDSVVRVGPLGSVILRRARGYAPGVVAELPTRRPILAVGPDLKNTVTLVVDGQAMVGSFIGDLAYRDARASFEESVADLLDMYAVARDDLLVAHDAHPEYVSTRFARSLPGVHIAVQHHRAHVAAVAAERHALDRPLIGVAFDGTGYGDDGAIWGGEVFVGCVRDGLERAAHLRPAKLPGGDAAAHYPPQAAAGFLHALDELPDLTQPPFGFSARYRQAAALVQRDVRCFDTTSAGRLFDTIAALVGFTREIGYEGQAAIWLEQLARRGDGDTPYPFPSLDYRPLLKTVIAERLAGVTPERIARGFHLGVAVGLLDVVARLSRRHGTDIVALSGGVFQNALLLEMIAAHAPPTLDIWTHLETPPNDGGVSLGQAAWAACRAAGE